MSSDSQSYRKLDDSSVSELPLNTDQAITRVGGMGCYQLVTGLIVWFLFTTVDILVYGLAFLQDTDNISIYCTAPDGTITHCDKADACNSDLTSSYFFDTRNGRTNFITEVPELLCVSDAKIGLQGTLYYVGFLIGSLVWLRLTDYWGRKWMMLGGLLLYVITLSVYLIEMSAITIYVTLFLFGFYSPFSMIGYMLIIESVSPRFRGFTGTAILLLDDLNSLCLPLIYQFGRDWWIVFWISFGLSVFSLFPLLFFIRESPKFYVSVGKFGKGREVYKYIARVNKKPMFSQQFEGERNSSDIQDKEKANHGIRELLRIK